MSGIARRGNIPHRGVSQAQVAAHAGVSAQTVSRVANQMENVDLETRDRVLASMRALGYRLNRTAVALRSGQYRTIGVVMFTLASFGNARTWESLALAADRADYSVALTPVDRPTGRVPAALARLAAQSIDGVIVLLEDHLLGDADSAILGDVPIGRVAVGRLLDLIAARDDEVTVASRSVVPTTLIHRASTARYSSIRSIR